MVRFSDAANSIIDGPSSVNNNNNNNTNNNHNDDNDGDDVLDSAHRISIGIGIGIGIGISNDGEETKQRSEEEATTVKVGQKRLLVTPHPANPNGKNAKKRSPNGASGISSGNDSGGNNDSNSIHAQTDACIMQEVESPDADMMTNASRHFESESSSSNNDSKIMNGDQNAEVEAIIANKNRHQHHDEENQEKSKNDEVGSKNMNSNNVNEKNDEGGGEENEEDMGVDENDGSDDNDNDNDNDHNKRWNDFVDSVDVKDNTPNLEAYLQEKKTRKCSAEQFENAIDVCIQSLRETTNEILSDVIEPVCNQYTERFDNTEDDIIKNLVSNHSRRNKLMKRMHDADDAWNNQFRKLTADILNEEIDIEETAEVGEKERNKGTGNDGKEVVVSGDQEDDPNLSNNKDPVAASGNPKEKTRTTDEGMYRPKNSIYGHEDSDLDELLDYEPNREKILSFMNERVKRNETMRNFGTVIDDVHTGLESEVESILQIASNLYVQHKEMCEDMEYDIESYMMENYGRRSDLQRELENSAQKAQKLFGSLLSRLGSLNGM